MHKGCEAPIAIGVARAFFSPGRSASEARNSPTRWGHAQIKIPTYLAFYTYSPVSTHSFSIDNLSMCPYNTPPTVTSYSPDILKETDYYAFGQEMPGRSWTANNYRYGMNGVERNNELATGYYDTYYRMYDSRIARWTSPDVIVIPNESPYIAMANNPIIFSDPLGDRVKYGSVSNFLKVAKMWLSSSAFRANWRKNVMDRYGMGGKGKEDLDVSVDANSNQTLSEAVASGNFETGKAKHDHKDHLKFNGNIDAQTFDIGENVDATVKAESGGSGRTSEEKFKVNFYGSSKDKNWRVRQTDKYIDPDVFASPSFDDKTLVFYVKIQQKRSEQLMGNANGPIAATYPDQLDYAPGWDRRVLTYHITAMGVRQVYRVERKLFGGWDFANKTPSTLFPQNRKTFTIKVSTSSIENSRNVYNTDKRNDENK